MWMSQFHLLPYTVLIRRLASKATNSIRSTQTSKEEVSNLASSSFQSHASQFTAFTACMSSLYNRKTHPPLIKKSAGFS